MAHVIAFVFVFVFASAAAEAANRHVTTDGAGSRDGSSWDHACDGFTGACSAANLVRGDSYFVADGDYTPDGPPKFSRPASGTLRIWIRKATRQSHGASAGWTDAMGDGVAIFDSVTFDGPYWTLDGQVGAGNSGFGFKIVPKNCQGVTLVTGINLGKNNSGMHLQHVEVAHCGEDLLRDGTVSLTRCLPEGNCGLQTDGIYSCNSTPTTDLQIRHVWVHDVTRDGITLCSVNDVLIEFARIERNHGIDNGSHGQGIAFIAPPMRNATIRNSVFADVVGTAAIAWLGSNGMTYSDMYVYGNVFYSSDPDRYWYSPNAIYGRVGVHQTGFLIYNNTFHNIVKAKTGLWGTTVTNSESRNNIYVNSEFSSNPPTTGMTYSHNFYFSNRGLYQPQGEPGQQNGSDNPFVNSLTADFRLRKPTQAGIQLGSTAGFQIGSIDLADRNGERRGADGVWDRGAFEFTTRPLSPSNVRLQKP